MRTEDLIKYYINIRRNIDPSNSVESDIVYGWLSKFIGDLNKLQTREAGAEKVGVERLVSLREEWVRQQKGHNGWFDVDYHKSLKDALEIQKIVLEHFNESGFRIIKRTIKNELVGQSK